MNSEVKPYIEAGNQPVSRFRAGLEVVNMTLSGYYVELQTKPSQAGKMNDALLVARTARSGKHKKAGPKARLSGRPLAS